MWVHIVGSEFEIQEWTEVEESTDEKTVIRQGLGCPELLLPPEEGAPPTTTTTTMMYWECSICTCVNYNGDVENPVCEACSSPRDNNTGSASYESKAIAKEPGLTVPTTTMGSMRYTRAVNIYSQELWSEPREQWILDVLCPVLQCFYPPEPQEKKLPYTLYLPEEIVTSDENVVKLIGYDRLPKKKKDGQEFSRAKR